MGSHYITFPKIRKAVHKVMQKYGKKKYYRKIDWIDKILEKLKEKPTTNLKNRIRNHINRWLIENSEIVNSKVDNKKGKLDSKITADPANNKDHSEEKKKEVNDRTNDFKEKQKQAQAQEYVSNSTEELSSPNKTIPPLPEAISIKKLKEKVSLVDLTSQKNVTEIITIDDEVEIIEEVEEVLPPPPLIMLPEQYYMQPNYSFYDYCPNNNLIYSAILQPHSDNF